MREMVVSLSSLLSFLLVSEATILPHYKIPVTGSASKLTPMLTLWLKHDGFQEEERAMSPEVPNNIRDVSSALLSVGGFSL